LSRKIALPAWKCLRYEVAINGVRILRKTVNDFSLWRLIEYPQTARWLDAAPGDLLLDIGSGTSSFGQMLAIEGAHVVVVDLSPERVEWQSNKAKQVVGAGGGSILPVVADATSLPFRAGSFKRVTSVSALEHVPNDRQAAVEIGRVMQDDGVTVITVPYTFDERKAFFAGLKSFERVDKNTFVQAEKNGYQVRFYTDTDIDKRFAQPAHSCIERVSYFGRRILNDWYHETALNRYWLSFILKDYVLAMTVHPLEEWFLRKTEPFGVIFRMRKVRN
jgi:ubiquinone/menaquinone biosynthesis C-methylase UbiE